MTNLDLDIELLAPQKYRWNSDNKIEPNMAEVAMVPREVVAATKKDIVPEEIIPDIIEEKRKDADGRVSCYRYLKGKLLGKVSVNDAIEHTTSSRVHLIDLI